MAATWPRVRGAAVCYVLPAAAVLSCSWLYVLGPSYYGAMAYVAVGLILMLTGVICGWRVWAVTICVCLAVIYSFGLQASIDRLEWTESDGVAPAAVSILTHAPDEPELVTLREEFGLQDIVCDADTGWQRLLVLTGWVSDRWRHSDTKPPPHSDPLTILRAAETGARFRCVEYSRVLAGVAQAVGMPARVLGLKTKKAAAASSGAGHVAVEVWLEDQARWVFTDPQYGYAAMLDGVPLNAVELQQALALGLPVQVWTADGPVSWLQRKYYLIWIAPYLHYLDFAIDQRPFVEPERRAAGALMLVPMGAPDLRLFQRHYPLTGYAYTSSLTAFYTPPPSSGR